jgi:predicted regulator of Ras-like GTPase activity (Roadblock/LC7/MglB family)
MSPAAVIARPALGRDLRDVLAELLKLQHIIGGLVVAPDGLVIAADLPREIQAEPLAALVATVGRELERRGPRLRRGAFPTAQFASVSGAAAFMGSTPVGFIVLLGGPRADYDTIRAALREAVGAVYRAWAG